MQVILLLLIGFFFFILLFVVAFIFSIVGKVLSIFNWRNYRKQTDEQQTTSNYQPTRKKMIQKDEGEYVDFEEIK